MAEFLIYNKDHWMDALTPEQLKDYIDKGKITQQKYDARYQRGDIVEVRPDGFFTETLKGDLSKWAFRVVVVQGLKPDKIYMEGTETRKRRFNVSTGKGQKITMIALKDLNITDKNG